MSPRAPEEYSHRLGELRQLAAAVAAHQFADELDELAEELVLGVQEADVLAADAALDGRRHLYLAGGGHVG